MEYVNIKGIDKPVSKLFLGTFGMFPDRKENSFKVLDAALELGVTCIDSARAYDSEDTIGDWMAERGTREKIVLLSKGGHPSDWRKRITPYDLDSDLAESLAQLRTDYLDIYLLHRDDEDLPVGTIVEKLNEYYAAGKVKLFGGSNWTHTRLEEANEYAYAHNLQPMSFSSPGFSLAEQVKNPFAKGTVTLGGNKNAEAQDWYTKNQMPVLAYSSLARGLFSGRVTKELFEKDPESVDMFCRIAYCYDENWERLDRVKKIAEVKGCSIPQVALAYVLDHRMNAFPIVGAQSKAELESSIGALNVKLTPQEVLYLELRAETGN